MKRSATIKNRSGRRQRRAAKVPTYEDCLTHVFDSIDFHSGNEKPQRISATDKLHFRQTDRHPERMGLPAYRRIIRRVLDQYLVGHQTMGKPVAGKIEVELRETLRRYENLLLSLTIGHADSRQVRWSLCVRFFVPWLALRIAFRLRHRPHDGSEEDERWFLPPTSHGKISSCFMLVVDRHVWKKGESQDAMARRLCEAQNVGAYDHTAKNLGRDFSRYRKNECTPLDTRLDFILKSCPQTPGLLAMMVLARAIDRNVQDAVKMFGQANVVKLVTFFRLSFDHFTHLLQRLDTTVPEDDERAWMFLQSQTFTGNTPFEADRFYPLMEPYMNSLAWKISTELQNVGRAGRLAQVPTTRSDFGKGKFPLIGGGQLPDEIHEAVRIRDFAAAVRASQSRFTSKTRIAAEAAGIGDWFSHMGLYAFNPATVNSPLAPSENDAHLVLSEAARLLGVAYAQANGVQKSQHGIRYLRFLLTPYRPKAKAEHPLAWKLYRVAAKCYRKSGHKGSSMFLLGCLLWLEGNEERAMRAFLRVVECGRASCDEDDWIRLLEYAPILAKRTSNKRALNTFLKISELEGVLYRESSPRTNLLEKEMRQHANFGDFQITFKPFSVRSSPATGKSKPSGGGRRMN